MRVEFHTDVADPLHFACRLLRKAYRSGARVAVFGRPADLSRLDQALWAFDARDFVPHARGGGGGAPPAAGLARTPIWLMTGPGPAPGCTVAVNLGLDDPEAFRGYERLIEIVSTEAQELQSARRRWRIHREQGAEIEHHAHGGGG